MSCRFAANDWAALHATGARQCQPNINSNCSGGGVLRWSSADRLGMIRPEQLETRHSRFGLCPCASRGHGILSSRPTFGLARLDVRRGGGTLERRGRTPSTPWLEARCLTLEQLVDLGHWSAPGFVPIDPLAKLCGSGRHEQARLFVLQMVRRCICLAACSVISSCVQKAI